MKKAVGHHTKKHSISRLPTKKPEGRPFGKRLVLRALSSKEIAIAKAFLPDLDSLFFGLEELIARLDIERFVESVEVRDWAVGSEL